MTLVLHYTDIYEQNKITWIFLKKCFITPTKKKYVRN